jgi:YesN/AraC family two-component response regulator
VKRLQLLNRLKDRSIFLGFLIILLVSIGVILQYDHNMRSEYMSERMYSYEKNHEKAYSSFYLFNEKTDSIYRQLLLNRNITEWLNNPGELIRDMYMLSEIQNSFLDLINSHSSLVSIYLHNRQNNIVISTPFMLSELGNFPNKEIFQKFYDSSQSFLWQPYGTEMKTNANGTRIISLTMGVPLHGSKGAVSINFNEAYIYNQLMGDMDSLLWLDSNNQVLLSKNKEAEQFFNSNKEEILGKRQTSFIYKEYFIISSAAEKESWRLLTLLPLSTLQAGHSGISAYMYFMIGLCFAMGLLLFLYFRFVRRAQELDVQVKLQRNLDDSRKGLVMELLNGKPLADLPDKLKEYEMDLSGSGYQVVVFQIDDYYNYLLTKSGSERLFMNKIIYNSIKWTFALRFSAYAVNTEPEKIVVLLCWEGTGEDDAARLEDAIRYMQDDIKANCGLTVCAGVSEVRHKPDQIHECYAHAVLALDYKVIYGKHSLIYYRRLPLNVPSSCLNVISKDIHKLGDCLREGRLDRIEEILNGVLEQMIASEQFTLDWIHAVFANIMSAIMKFVIEQRIDINEHCNEDIFITLYSYEFLEEKKAYVLSICSIIIRQLQSPPEEKNTTAKLIVEYIDKHFDQPLSLSMLADELSLSPSYLSVAIKHHLGIGFVDYINKLRIQKALKLLEYDDMTIQQIAEQCGYDTVHTFIRRFKKTCLMPPNEYRVKTKAAKTIPQK